jgi:hypothetical protein
MKKSPWLYGLFLGLAIVATARFAPPKPTIASVTAAPTVDETWTIPGVGLTPGLNDTRFVSDLALTNLGVAPANVTLSFTGPGGLPPQSFTIAAGATTTYRNVIDAFWDITGVVGALSVHADQPLVLRARTYNTAATGTFGVSLPVYSSDHLIGEGETADSLWVQQDSSSSSGFRTNVGVVFPDAAGGEAAVTLYDAAGGLVGTLNYSSASAGFQQQSVASVAPAGLPVGRAQISVTRGHAAGYAVGVDNVTGDTSLYALEALPAGVQDVVVSGVARLNGRNNTFFRTDARFYNQTPTDATVTVRFHSVGAANPTPQTATINVPAGRIIEVVDVLASILNAPVGSGGALRFTADQPIAILSRTSNVDPQGAQPGTFGAQQHPVPLASYLSSADAGAVVTAIRQDTAFRTNIGFAAGADGAAYNLALKDSQGSVSAVTTGALGAFGWAQPSIADLFPGTTIPADATLLVQVTQGTVDVYDASLDNASGDLVVTPIAPVPAALPTSASIGPSGGSIQSADGRLTLKVPAGALAAPTTLSIAPITNTAPNAIGSGYSLSPAGVAFQGAAQLVLAYTNADLNGTGAGALGIASDDGSSWQAILGGSLDPVARALTVPVSSTSPVPTAAAGRRIQNARARGNLGPYGSVHIEPKSAVVPVRGRLTLSLNFVGPSSTSTSSRGFFALVPGGVLISDVRWSVTGDFLPNAPYGRISATAGLNAVYTAPNCIPQFNPVSVGASVRASGGGHFPATASVNANVRVIERDWRIEVTYESRSRCVLGAAWSLEYTRGHDGAFSLDDDGRVIDYVPGLTHTQTTSPAWCPGFGNSCTQPALVSPIGDLNLSDVTGRLVSDGLIDNYFLLTVTVQVPGAGAQITFTCASTPPSTVIEPVFHGTPPVAGQEVLVRFPDLDETREFVYPSGIESARVKLTPIKPAGCP